MAKAQKTSAANKLLPPPALPDIQPPAPGSDSAGQRALRLLRGDFRRDATYEDLSGIPPMVLYRALQDGLVPADPVVKQILRDHDVNLTMLASFLPLMPDQDCRDKLLAGIRSFVEKYPVKADDADLVHLFPILWPQLDSHRVKELFLEALVKYVKRRAKSKHRDTGAPLLTRVGHLEPAWYPSLVELSLQIASRRDLFFLLLEGDTDLAAHLLSRPEFASMADHPSLSFVAADRFPRDPASSLRMLDLFPALARGLLRNLANHRSRSMQAAISLVTTWAGSRDPEVVCNRLPALEIAASHPDMADPLLKAVLSRLCADPVSAYQALAHGEFFKRLSVAQGQMLITAAKPGRQKLVSATLLAGANTGTARDPMTRYIDLRVKMQVLADLYGDLPPEHQGRRTLAVDLTACLLALETNAQEAFLKIDRELAHNIKGDSFLEALLQTWADAAADEVKTVWRAMAPQDADTATGLVDGMLTRTPQCQTDKTIPGIPL